MFISLQPDGVHLWFFKLKMFDLKELVCFNYNIGLQIYKDQKSEFVANT